MKTISIPPQSVRSPSRLIEPEMQCKSFKQKQLEDTEDIKVVIIIHISKRDRQHNGRKDKQRSAKPLHRTVRIE